MKNASLILIASLLAASGARAARLTCLLGDAESGEIPFASERPLDATGSGTLRKTGYVPFPGPAGRGLEYSVTAFATAGRVTQVSAVRSDRGGVSVLAPPHGDLTGQTLIATAFSAAEPSGREVFRIVCVAR